MLGIVLLDREREAIMENLLWLIYIVALVALFFIGKLEIDSWYDD
jgi:hypothetical protein